MASGRGVVCLVLVVVGLCNLLLGGLLLHRLHTQPLPEHRLQEGASHHPAHLKEELTDQDLLQPQKKRFACGDSSPGSTMADSATLEKLEEAFKKVETSESKSLLKKFLTKEIFDQLKEKKTELGASLLDVIQSGVENPDSGIGIYAPDAEAYTLFASLFDPIIEDYHVGFGHEDKHPASDFGDVSSLVNVDPEGKYVVSTRVRCGRSMKGYPFNPCLNEENYKEMEEKVTAAFSAFEGELAGKYHPLTGMSKEVQQQLIDDHFLFKEGDRFLQSANACRYWPTGRGIFHNENKSFLVWVNEEDHLRLISMQKGGDLGEIYRRLVNAVKEIEKKVPFSHDERLGFLTFCPTNLGTTIRASVHIKLPKLAADKTKLEEVAAKYNLQVRGTTGEHTEAVGGIYDISNKRRMGLTEYQAVKEMQDGILELIKMEESIPDKVEVDLQATKLEANVEDASGTDPLRLRGGNPGSQFESLEACFNTLESTPSKSLLKKHLTKEIYGKLKDKKTKLGATLLDVIQSGVANPDSAVGVYAPDVEAYAGFSLLFNPIIEDYHIGFGKNAKQPLCTWGDQDSFGNLDIAGNYVLSTRIRVARSIAGLPFNPCLTEAQYLEMETKVKAACDSLEDDLKGTYFPLGEMTPEDQEQLIQDHFLFCEGDRYLQAANACNFWPIGRGIFHNRNKNFLMWVGEEDHIRLISMEMGGDLGKVYKRLTAGCEKVEKLVPFARHHRLGYLTFCPSNLGTTIRASVHIKLPKLGADYDKLVAEADKYNLQVRGTHGELSGAVGGVYDISNKRRMGLNEFELVKEMQDGILALIELEKEAPEPVISQDTLALNAAFEKLQSATTCQSLLKKNLTNNIFSELKGKKTGLGATLLDVIQSGCANLDSGVGVYAPDAEAYSVFAPLFDPIIEDYHIGFTQKDKHPGCDFGDVNSLVNLDPEGRYVVSTRVRCGRSLEGYPFNPCLTEDNYKEMEMKVSGAFNNFQGELQGTYFPLTGMKQDTQQQLIDDHFLFKEGDRFLQAANACRYWPTGRGIFHNQGKSFLVWVNEEDHLRLISMQPGGDLGEVYRRLVTAAGEIEKQLPFSHHDRLGFLTFCPTNLGTTIRASVHIKLPHLAADREKLEEVATKYNLQVRGTTGEHTEAVGGVYDISNKRRMGLTEYEAVKEMQDGILELISIEKSMTPPEELEAAPPCKSVDEPTAAVPAPEPDYEPVSAPPSSVEISEAAFEPVKEVTPEKKEKKKKKKSEAKEPKFEEQASTELVPVREKEEPARSKHGEWVRAIEENDKNVTPLNDPELEAFRQERRKARRKNAIPREEKQYFSAMMTRSKGRLALPAPRTFSVDFVFSYVRCSRPPLPDEEEFSYRLRSDVEPWTPEIPKQTMDTLEQCMDILEHKSLMKKYLTRKLYKDLKDRKTQSGATLLDCIQSGVANPDSKIGLYAPDAEAYDLFEPLFWPIIQEYHPKLQNNGKHPASDFGDLNDFVNLDIDRRFVVSTRIRVCRSLEGYPMTPMLTQDMYMDMEKKVQGVLNELEGELRGTYFPLTFTSKVVQQQLLDERCLFVEDNRYLHAANACRYWPTGRGIFHNRFKNFLVWVNYEDHLRLISMQKGGDLRETYRRLVSAVSEMESRLPFATHPRYGHLTTCPGNLGTTIRASVHIKLPHIPRNEIDEICSKFNLRVRGEVAYPKIVGEVWDITNSHRVGYTEWQIVRDLQDGILALIKIESERSGEEISAVPTYAPIIAPVKRASRKDRIMEELAVEDKPKERKKSKDRKSSKHHREEVEEFEAIEEATPAVAAEAAAAPAEVVATRPPLPPCDVEFSTDPLPDKVAKKLEKYFNKLDSYKSLTCISLLKKYLDRNLYEDLKDRRTMLGSCLMDVIQSGCLNLDSGCGVYAPDADSYSVFGALFDPIIEDYHGFKSTDKHPAPNFGDVNSLVNLDPDNEFIVSTRVRCGRSIKGYPFNPCLTEENYIEMEMKVEDALTSLTKELKGTYYPLMGMSDEIKQQLIDDHFLFKEGDRFLQGANACRYWPMGRGIYHNNMKTFLVWVNEEDHMRIISMQNGGDLGAIYRRMVLGVKNLEKKLEFAHHDRLGYLTFCPTNLGTTIRASVHIKLPILSANLEELERVAGAYNLQVRGTSGEHSEAVGGVYDISNKRRLGLTEYDAVKEMQDGILKLIEMEKAGGVPADFITPAAAPAAAKVEAAAAPAPSAAPATAAPVEATTPAPAEAAPVPADEEGQEAAPEAAEEAAFAVLAEEADAEPAAEEPVAAVEAVVEEAPAEFPTYSTLDDALKALKAQKSTSLIKKNLTDDLIKKLSAKKTKTGATMLELIHSGVANPDSVIGVYCPDKESYALYSMLLNPIIQDFHVGFGKNDKHPKGDWGDVKTIGHLDSSGKYVKSVRIRIVRTVDGYPWGPALTEEQYVELEGKLSGALDTLEEDLKGTYTAFADIAPEDKEELQNSSIMFKNPDRFMQAGKLTNFWPTGRGIFHNRTKQLCAWVNYEDHLQLVSMQQGGNLGKCYTTLVDGINALSKHIPFVFHHRLGFLTCCPSNLGTALRASVHITLPNLGADFKKLEAKCAELNLCIRGTKGEKTEVGEGGVFDISNRRRLGLTEYQAVKEMQDGIKALVDEEINS